MDLAGAAGERRGRGRLARLLLERLVHDGVLTAITSQSGATIFAIPPSGVVIAPTATGDLTAGHLLLACGTCRALTPGSRTTVDQLDGGPCMLVRCRGRRRSPCCPIRYRIGTMNTMVQ